MLRPYCRFLPVSLTATFVLLLGCQPRDEPPAQFVVRRSTDLGVVESSARIAGRDGGHSAKLAGRSVWLFGDTVLTQEATDGRSWRQNSYSVTEDTDAANGLTGFTEPEDAAGAPLELLPNTEAEATFNDLHLSSDCEVGPCGDRWAVWPRAIVADEMRDRALVFYTKVYAERGDSDGESVGWSVAEWQLNDVVAERAELAPDSEYPTLMFQDEEQGFGSGAVIDDEYLYVYGCNGDGLNKPCSVARVPLADALDRASWRYWAGDGEWSPSIGRIVRVFDGNDALAVSYDEFLGVFTVVYSKPLENRVMMRSAPRPEGPWSREEALFNAKPPTEGWVHDAVAHSEFAHEGLLYITYSRNTGSMQSEFRLVEVEVEAKSPRGEAL